MADEGRCEWERYTKTKTDDGNYSTIIFRSTRNQGMKHSWKHWTYQIININGKINNIYDRTP